MWWVMTETEKNRTIIKTELGDIVGLAFKTDHEFSVRHRDITQQKCLHTTVLTSKSK
jgi:hypothetical protein